MAAGDISYDTEPVRSIGDHFMVTGTIEVDDTAREFAVVPNGYLIWANVHDADDVSYARVTLNSDDGTIGSKSGSIYVDGSASGPDTFHFSVGCKM